MHLMDYDDDDDDDDDYVKDVLDYCIGIETVA
jgi:hypothetical protein